MVPGRQTEEIFDENIRVGGSSDPDEEVQSEGGRHVDRLQAQSGRRVWEQDREGLFGVHQELWRVISLLEEILETETCIGQRSGLTSNYHGNGMVTEVWFLLLDQQMNQILHTQTQKDITCVRLTWMFLMKDTVTRSSNSFRGV